MRMCVECRICLGNKSHSVAMQNESVPLPNGFVFLYGMQGDLLSKDERGFSRNLKLRSEM